MQDHPGGGPSNDRTSLGLPREDHTRRRERSSAASHTEILLSHQNPSPSTPTPTPQPERHQKRTVMSCWQSLGPHRHSNPADMHYKSPAPWEAACNNNHHDPPKFTIFMISWQESHFENVRNLSGSFNIGTAGHLFIEHNRNNKFHRTWFKYVE